MNQLYEKKCDCIKYEDLNNDYRSSSVIAMELPEYEAANRRSAMRRGICLASRCIFSILILITVCYSLWRIHEIEKMIKASDRYVNITRLIESNNLSQHVRIARSVQSNSYNGLDDPTDKGIQTQPKDQTLSWPSDSSWPKPKNKDDFKQLMNSLFDRIEKMHNDEERSHFDNNIKAVFQAWFPVFDALMPKLPEASSPPTEEVRFRRAAELTDENDVSKSDSKSSEENKGKPAIRVTRSIDENDVSNSKSSSEENKGKPARVTRSIDENDVSNSKSSSEEKKPARIARSAESSEESSSDNSDSHEKKNLYKLRNRQYSATVKDNNKSSEESSESSESNESKIKKSRNQSSYFYLISDNKATQNSI